MFTNMTTDHLTSIVADWRHKKAQKRNTMPVGDFKLGKLAERELARRGLS